MACTLEKILPRAEFVLQKLPLSKELQQKVVQDRAEIDAILEGKDNRKLFILGPCSAWPSQAVIEYAHKLKPVADEVSDKIKIIFRAYTQKPRTKLGWTGSMNQPDPFLAPDLEAGIFYCRDMMLRLVEAGFSVADEAVFTHNEGYFVDTLAWIAIGARSTEDQEHRIFASMMPHPVGMKNPTDGRLEIGINSVIAAQNPHVFALHGKQMRSSGNPHAHLVLRGGDGKPNFDPASLKKATELLHTNDIKFPAFIVDASHENSVNPATGQKDPLLQPDAIYSVIESAKQDEDIARTLKGFMAESFLVDGKQDVTKAASAEDLTHGCSITDGCLGFERTRDMLYRVAEML